MNLKDTYIYKKQVVKHYLTQFGPRLNTEAEKNPVRFHGIKDDPPLTPWFGKGKLSHSTHHHIERVLVYMLECSIAPLLFDDVSDVCLALKVSLPYLFIK
jgi:hypothetical protein